MGSIDRGSSANIFVDQNLEVGSTLILPKKLEIPADEEPGSIGLGPDGKLIFKDDNGVTQTVPTGENVGALIDDSKQSLNETWSSEKIWAEIIGHVDSTTSASLADLLNRLTVIQAAINGDDPALDQIKELADRIKGDDVALISFLAAKINVTDILNTLTATSAGKVLDARQGKVLSDMITGLNSAITLLSGRIDGINRASLGVDEVDNVSDFNKALSKAMVDALAFKASLSYVDGKILVVNKSISDLADLLDQQPQKFSEIDYFTFDGTNNTRKVSFVPVGIDIVFMNSVPLNPFIDYRYDQNNLIIKPALLRQGQSYDLYINYLK